MGEQKQKKSVESEQSLEELFEKLRQNLDKLEEEELPLEEAFAAYEQGMKLVKLCNDKIDSVEKKMQMLTGDGQLVDFEEI